MSTELKTNIFVQAMAHSVCGNLKPGHELRLCMENGAAWVTLTGPDGYEIDLPDSADQSLEEQISNAVAVSNGVNP